MRKKQKTGTNGQIKEEKTAVKINAKETTEKMADPNFSNVIKELEERIAVAEQEAKENYDRFLRVSAEFENYKKRTAREMDDFRRYANEDIVKEMLLVVDNLERAIATKNESRSDNGGLVEGVQLTLKDMLTVFGKFHIKPIEALGKGFDPNYHQAVQQEESEDLPNNTITREFQKGYTIHDRLLRPAMVVVAKSKIAEVDLTSETPAESGAEKE